MERFHDHYGAQPTGKDLREFARGNGIPYPDPRRVKFSAGLGEWIAQRRANDRPDPKVVRRRGRPPRNSRPDYSRDVGAARPGKRCASGAGAPIRHLGARVSIESRRA